MTYFRVQKSLLESRGIQDLRGMTLYDATGDEVGKITSILADDERPGFYFAEVSGGVMGLYDKHFLVPLSEISVRHGEAHVMTFRDKLPVVPPIRDSGDED
ncbi:MAG: PRC-barrel domain-containing protein [Chloroflexi bacterium]|nr:PRC-barrel domain-containing protein [Chloroflexota bacterium]